MAKRQCATRARKDLADHRGAEVGSFVTDDANCFSVSAAVKSVFIES